MNALRHAVVLAWLALLIGLGVRGLVNDNARYAWGMYPYAFEYRISYRWRLQDGTERAYRPGKELRGLRAVLGPKKKRQGWYGRGALLQDVEAYVAWAAGSKRAPPNAAAFEAVVKNTKFGAPTRVDVIAQPVRARTDPASAAR